MKPDNRIFELAESKGKFHHKVHIGDDFINDYQAAIQSGWNSLLLDRHQTHKEDKIMRISSLNELIKFI